MTVLAPATVREVVEALSGDPELQLLAGGTDFMVEVNFGHRRPAGVVSLHRVDELKGWHLDGGTLTLGAGLTYSEMERPPLADLLPALAQAARTVGSPQIRNAGTLGGNLATASPAGDTLPVLAALDATVVVEGLRGRRELALTELISGVKRTSLAPDEVVVAAKVPVLRGPQEFLKVGTRNAMVISIVSVAVVVDLDGHTVRCGLGSVSPIPQRAADAEALAERHVDWDAARITDPAVYDRFGERAAAAAAPIDDQRGTAAYRRHAVGVCAARALRRALPPRGPG
jgi:CO/xanthine dehydrogenase FAD-binding subunit